MKTQHKGLGETDMARANARLRNVWKNLDLLDKNGNSKKRTRYSHGQ